MRSGNRYKNAPLLKPTAHVKPHYNHSPPFSLLRCNTAGVVGPEMSYLEIVLCATLPDPS